MMDMKPPPDFRNQEGEKQGVQKLLGAERKSETMKARIPKHREFVINLETTAEERREECWAKLEAILEDYKKEGKSVYTPSFIEDNEEKVKALQAEYGFEYTIELK